MADRQGQGSERAVRGGADVLKGAEGAGSPDRGDRLRFQLLGPVRAWRGDRPLNPGPPQQRAVLALLLLHAGRPVSVPQLVDALWGEQPPPRAVGTLRTYVSRLRGLLEPDRRPRQQAHLLVSSGGGYALRVPGGALDASVFEERLATARRLREAGDTAGAYKQLRGALALPAGMALAGLPGPYAQRQRDRLTELCVTAQEELFDCVVKLGGQAGAIGGLRAFAAEHPLRERTQALLMRALHRAGRQAEALAVYAATRRTLDAELGAGPGRELRALYEELRTGPRGSGTEPGRPGTGPLGDRARPDRDRTGGSRDRQPRPPRPDRDTSRIGPPPPVPAQLPPDIADFAGRAEAVAHLAPALRGAAGARAPVVATLSGLGGVGKTALAVHVAHSVRAHFPDGQLYVDLQGSGLAPEDSSAVLTHFLRALGVAERAVPDGLAQKAALYRSLLADREVLVLLDNARDSAQVRPLLPGAPGCAVLVTSRARTLALPGADRVDVEVMAEGEALGLLGAIVGAERVAAEPTAARELVAVCDGLPLAVRIAAARLASRPGRDMAGLVARLSEERRLDELRVGDLGVEATFRVGYEALGPGLAHAFRALSLCGMPSFCRGAAAALLDTTDDEAEEAVETLVDAGLVELHGEDRYRYHDLVGLFARRLGERHDSPCERAAAQHRFFDYVLATVLTAVRLIEPHRVLPDLLRHPDSPGRTLADADAARAWLHDAHPRLYAAVERALGAAPGLLGSAVDLLTAWSQVLGSTARHRDLEPLVRRAVDTARQHGDDTATAHALRLLRVPHHGAAPHHGTETYARAESAPGEILRPAHASVGPPVSVLAEREPAVVPVAMDRERAAPPLLTTATDGSEYRLSQIRYQARCALRRDGPPRQAAVPFRQARRRCRLRAARDRARLGPGGSERGPPLPAPAPPPRVRVPPRVRARKYEGKAAVGRAPQPRQGAARCRKDISLCPRLCPYAR
ncbi:AfsR/SARP family transcriptional regulator [Streptomyces sp. C10]|uniref:AfsR/SARP family transcriptional regulator n=1 Tax=Streptomyces sp. C10 TaxID=531941 RepID=UPI00397EE65E